MQASTTGEDVECFGRQEEHGLPIERDEAVLSEVCESSAQDVPLSSSKNCSGKRYAAADSVW